MMATLWNRKTEKRKGPAAYFMRRPLLPMTVTST